MYVENEDGTPSEVVKERTYDLKSKAKGMMIQASIPGTVPVKKYDYNAEVELVNPVLDTVVNATFQGAVVDWYLKADDIRLKAGSGKTTADDTKTQTEGTPDQQKQNGPQTNTSEQPQNGKKDK